MLPPTLLSPDQLRALLVTVIAGVKGEPEAKWIKIVGKVEALPAWRGLGSSIAGQLAARYPTDQCGETSALWFRC